MELDPLGEFSLEVEDHCSQPMAPGASCSVTVSYAPQDDIDDATTLRVTADGGIEVTAAITGEALPVAPGVELTPASLDFGQLPLNAESSQSITLTNTGTSAIADFAIGLASMSNHQDQSFSFDDEDCLGITLTQGQSCTIEVTFLPRTAGSLSDTLTVTYEAYSPKSVQLSGEGVESDLLADPKLEFGPVRLGEGGHLRMLNVSNTGTAQVGPLDPAEVTTNAGDDAFSINSDGCSGQTLSPGGSCQVEILFDPQSPGKQEGSVRVTAGNNLTYTSLVGTTTDLWVDAAAGSPNNDGLSPSEPMDTITQALAVSDSLWTIHLAPGVYAQKEVFPLDIAGQHLVGDASNRPQLVPQGVIDGLVNIGQPGSTLLNLVLDTRSAMTNGDRRGVIEAAVSSNGGDSDDLTLENLQIFAGQGWDGVHMMGLHSSTQLTLADSTLTCDVSDTAAIAVQVAGMGWNTVTSLTVSDCRDGVVAAGLQGVGGSTTVNIGFSDLSGCSGDSVRVEGEYSGASMINMGMYDNGGQNNLAGSASTHVGLNVLATPGNGVRLKGNTWKASVQGASASGTYSSGTIPGPVQRVDGNNYAIASGASIQFLN